MKRTQPNRETARELKAILGAKVQSENGEDNRIRRHSQSGDQSRGASQT
jgi:hypothetical protein